MQDRSPIAGVPFQCIQHSCCSATTMNSQYPPARIHTGRKDVVENFDLVSPKGPAVWTTIEPHLPPPCQASCRFR